MHDIMCIEVIYIMKNKKGYIIAVTNQKGGTGKTTVSINLGVSLAKAGAKVLLVDNDKQINLTTGLIVNDMQYEKNNIGTILEKVLIGEPVKLQKHIIHTRYVDVVAGSRDLHTFKKDFETRSDRNTVYKNLLSKVREQYDYILIDCPPVAGIENAQAYSAANGILIVSEPSMYSLDGIVDAAGIVNDAIISENPELKVLGVVVNKVHCRRIEDQGYLEEINEMCRNKIHVFQSFIPECAAVAFGKLAKEVM